MQRVWSLCLGILSFFNVLISYTSLARDLREDHLRKREMILDCENLPVPEIPSTAQPGPDLRRFRTLSEICTSSAIGFELSCDEVGHIRRPHVFGPIWRHSNRWLLETCLLSCDCFDVGPSTPKLYEHSRQPGKPLHPFDDTGSSPTDEQQAVSRPANGRSRTQCYNQDQCNAAAGQICSQPGTSQVSKDDAWLHFQCNYVPHVSETISSTLKAGRCRTGKCLLEVNGSVTPLPPVNENKIKPSRSGLSAVNYGDNDSFRTTSLKNESNNTGGSAIMSLEVNALNVAPGQTSTGQRNISERNALVPVRSTSLVCPCNCTYIDFGCCFSSALSMTSGPAFHGRDGRKPPFPGMTCDPYTGLWLAPQDPSQQRREDDSPKPRLGVEMPTVSSAPPKTPTAIPYNGEIDSLGSFSVHNRVLP